MGIKLWKTIANKTNTTPARNVHSITQIACTARHVNMMDAKWGGRG